MNKLLSLVFVVGINLFGLAAAQAITVVPFGPPQVGLTIPVTSGCGIGVRRGPFDGCTPIYGVYGGYYGGHYRGYYLGYHRGYRRGYYRGYRDAYYDGPYVRYHDDGGVIAVDKGFCGFGSYLACSHGSCWRFCY
jgi:hypothetical protein